MKKLAILIIPFLLIGCLSLPKKTVQTYPRENEFIEEDFFSYKHEGDSSISGQAFMKTQGGDVKYPAGETVFLYPKTPYTEEIVTRTLLYKYILYPKVDEKLMNYVRTTIADGEGRFDFKELPPGNYYIAIDVFWMVPKTWSSGLQQTGDVAIAEICLSEGEDLDIIASRPANKYCPTQ